MALEPPYINQAEADSIMQSILIAKNYVPYPEFENAINGIDGIVSSGYILVNSTVLPNETGRTEGYSIVPANTYTQTTGGNVVTTTDFTILYWNGTTWSIAIGFTIDLSGYVPGAEIAEDYFEVADGLGRVAFRINADGTLAFTYLTPLTIQRLKTQLEISEIPKKIYGKKINVIGDSISTDTGGAGLNEASIYLGLLRDNQGCTIFKTAIGGTMIADNVSSSIPFVDPTRWGLLNTGDPDMIFIEGGINDFIRALNALGLPTDAPSNSTTATFCASLKYLYGSILDANRFVKLFHLLPMHTTYIPLLPGSAIGYNGTNYLTEYIDYIKKIASDYGVCVINLFQNSGINDFNIGDISSDGLHVNEVGHEMMYDTIVNEVEVLL